MRYHAKQARSNGHEDRHHIRRSSALQGLLLTALVATSAARAAAPPAPTPGTASIRGHVELIPRHGTGVARDGDPYGTSQVHGPKVVDYTRPELAVVYLAGGPPPGGRTAVEYTANGFVHTSGVVGAGGSVVLKNSDLRPHSFTAPSVDFLHRLDPGAEVEIQVVAAEELAIFALGTSDRVELLVSPGPYSEVSRQGRWRLTGLSPGPAVLRAWHPRLPGEERAIVVREGHSQRIRLRIGVDTQRDTMGENQSPAGQPNPEIYRLPESLARSAERFDLLGGRVRVSGSGRIGYYGGRQPDPGGRHQVEIADARQFITADLGRAVWLNDTKILRGVNFLYEHEVYRTGFRFDRAGEHYLELRGVLDSQWLNVQVGRFQLPVSENYLRFGRGTRQNPFASNALGAPWYNDEGIKIWGADADTGLGYVVSLTDGELDLKDRMADIATSKQVSLRVFADATPWLHLSASVLRCGEIGSFGAPASSGIWFGDSLIRPLGSRTAVPTLHHGAAIPDGPPVVSHIELIAGDVVLRSPAGVRLWLAGGAIDVAQPGGDRYQRNLSYWLAEAQLPGAAMSPALERLSLAVRINGYGTFDRNEGYLLDVFRGATLGYNMSAVRAASVAASWRLAPGLEIRTDYTRTEIDLVRGASPVLRASAHRTSALRVEAGIHF